MTEAYVTGFCKTAEEYGVSPQQLMKVAGIPAQWAVKSLPGFLAKSTIPTATMKKELPIIKLLLKDTRLSAKERTALNALRQDWLVQRAGGRMSTIAKTRNGVRSSFEKVPENIEEELSRLYTINKARAERISRLPFIKRYQLQEGADTYSSIARRYGYIPNRSSMPLTCPITLTTPPKPM